MIYYLIINDLLFSYLLFISYYILFQLNLFRIYQLILLIYYFNWFYSEFINLV